MTYPPRFSQGTNRNRTAFAFGFWIVSGKGHMYHEYTFWPFAFCLRESRERTTRAHWTSFQVCRHEACAALVADSGWARTTDGFVGGC